MIHDIAEKFGMESNGFSMFSDENFEKNHDLPCYIPEYAENAEGIYSRNDLKEMVTEWLKKEETLEYLLEAYDNKLPKIDNDLIEGFVVGMFETIEWEMPSTYLNSMTL